MVGTINWRKLIGRPRIPDNPSFVNTMGGIDVYDGSIPIAHYGSFAKMPSELQEKYAVAFGLKDLLKGSSSRVYEEKKSSE